MKSSEKRVALLQKLGIIALILVCLKYLSELFGPQIDLLFDAINAIVFPLVVALFISYLLAPIVKLVDKKINKRWISVIIVFIILFIIFTIFVFLIGNMIYDQAVIFFSSDWESILVYIQNFTENNARISEMYESISAYINIDTVSPVIVNVVNVFRSIASVLISIVLIPVFLFFIVLR